MGVDFIAISFSIYLYMSNSENKAVMKGRVIENLPATNFKVELESGNTIIAYLSGKMRMHYIKIMPGDTVLLELSPDGERGRIVRRL